MAFDSFEIKQDLTDPNSGDSADTIELAQVNTSPASTMSASDLALTEATRNWRDLTVGKNPEEVKRLFQANKTDFLDVLEIADETFEREGKAMEAALPGFRADSPGPGNVIESLQELSSALDAVPPKERRLLMETLSDSFKAEELTTQANPPYRRVVSAFERLSEEIDDDLNASDIARAWFPYRESIGDTIGPRLVVAGLLEMFGNDADKLKASELKQQVSIRKDTIGGFYTD